MTMMTALMMTITLTMSVVMVPRIYYAYRLADILFMDEEVELLRRQQMERNDWVLRHLGCGVIAFVLVYMVKTSPELDVPETMAGAMALYAGSCLAFAVCESLLAQKIADYLATIPVRVKVRDRE